MFLRNCITELSSVHSLVQMAGRVLRHRDIIVDKANVGILKYNLNHCCHNMKDDKTYVPGIESSEEIKLISHNSTKTLNDINLNNVNAIPNIVPCDVNYTEDRNFKYFTTLNVAEHYEHSLLKDFTNNSTNIGSMDKFVNEYIYLTGESAKINKFRQAQYRTVSCYLCENALKCYSVIEYKDIEYYLVSNTKNYDVNNLWFPQNYKQAIRHKAKEEKTNNESACKKYGTVDVKYRNKMQDNMFYDDGFGCYAM